MALKLKDLCILKITEFPSECLNIPEEIIPRLYLGIHYSEKLYTIRHCDFCREERPCRHDKVNRCVAYTPNGHRCKNNGDIQRKSDGKYLCQLHVHLPYCSYLSCNELSIDPIGGWCWNHTRQNKCIAMNFDGSLCSRYAMSHSCCMYHQAATHIPRQCMIEGCPFVRHQHIYLRCGLCIDSSDFGESCIGSQLCYNHLNNEQWKIIQQSPSSFGGGKKRKRRGLDMYLKMSTIIL